MMERRRRDWLKDALSIRKRDGTKPSGSGSASTSASTTADAGDRDQTTTDTSTPATDNSSRRTAKHPTYQLDGDHKQAFRVRGIPVYYDIETLRVSLSRALKIHDAFSIRIYSLASDESPNDESRTATVSFSARPAALDRTSDRWPIEIPDNPGSAELITIYVDSHFLGFTPLSPEQTDSLRTIDCIAIHGLGGHALGSFSDPKSCFVWLRDEVAKSFPTLRVWTYGYDSSLRSTGAYGDVQEYAADFRQLLKALRNRSGSPNECPLMFVAHSLGGLLLKEAFISMQNGDEAEKTLLRSTYSMLFFGVPSQGMETRALAAMVDRKPQRLTLEMLNQTRGHLLRERQHKQFCDAFHFRDSRFVRFYELVESPTVQEDPSTKAWVRNGTPVLLVTQASASRGRPWDVREHDMISIMTDHMGIVKFPPDDMVEYPKVKGILAEIVQCAAQTIRLRSTGPESYSDPTDMTWFKLPRAVEAELHATQDEAKTTHCLKGTRVELLDDIRSWTSNPDGPCIFWLSGVAGSGKSTIARTIASELYDKGHLGASFFFSRDQDNANHTKLLASTMAFQLAKNSPATARHVKDAIKKEPEIAAMLLMHQWKELIISPIARARFETGQSSPKILVVDALDECKATDAVALISTLLNVAERLQSAGARVLITCRQQSHIEISYREIPHESRKHIKLHKVDRQKVDHDIRLFLETELHIRMRLDLQPDVLKQLVELSAGLFIFAATVCRHVRKIPLLATERLSNILKSLNSEHLAPLDTLYLQALREAVDANASAREVESLCNLLKTMAGTVVLLAIPLPVGAIASLLDERVDQTKLLLESLQAVLDIPESDEHAVRAFHESFHDFLLDDKRCADVRFHVQEEEIHGFLAERCLEIMRNKLNQDLCGLRSPGALNHDVREDHQLYLSVELRYSCKYWAFHVQKSKMMMQDDGTVYAFLRTRFLNWLEAMSLMALVPDSVIVLRSLAESFKNNTASRLFAFVSDALRFVLTYHSMIEQAPLQVYHSALLFSPSKSIIRHCFKHEIPSWVINFSAVPGHWSALLQTLEGHVESVTSVAFSPDGTRIVSGSLDRTVRVWDAATGTLQQTLGGRAGMVRSVAFSPDGTMIVSGSIDNTVRVWDAATGALQQTLDGHAGSVRSVAFSPDGTRIVSGSNDRTVRVWDAATGALQQTLDGHAGSVTSVAFSPDGTKIVTGSGDNTVRVWDAATGALQQLLDGHADEVISVAFSPDGSRIVSGSDDRTVRVWDAATGALQQTLDGHADGVTSVAFSPDGTMIVSGSIGWTVRAWDAATGALQQTLDGHAGSVTSVAFSPDGSRIVSGSIDRTVRVWDAATGALQQMLDGHADWVRSVSFSPDGSSIVSGSHDSTARVWDAATGALQQMLEGHADGVISVAFSPDGTRIVSGSIDRTVRVWDAATGALQQTLDGHADWVRSVAFSPDGSRIVSGSGDCTVMVWNAATGALQQTLEGHAGLVTSVAFSPDGSRIVSGSDDSTVRVWDAATGALQQLLDGHADWVRSVAYSPDGTRIVSGSDDRTVRVWDAATGALQQSLDGHADWVISIAFSPDGSKIVSGSGDSTVMVWDAATGALQQTLDGHAGSVTSVASSPDDEAPKINIQGGQWVTVNTRRVLLLPENRRASVMAVRDGILAIGSISGLVTILHIDLDKALPT